MSWKNTLYDYLRTYNQWEINGAKQLDAVRSWVTDERYLTIQKERLLRLKEVQQERKIEPIRNETRVRFDTVAVNKRSVEAAIVLRRKLWYVQNETEQAEERLERKTMRWNLGNDEKSWYCSQATVQTEIDGIEMQAEALASHQMASHQKDMANGGAAPSKPYLNSHLLHPRTARFDYDRAQVKRYADLWWDHPNPEYNYFEVDCTNYVSQCIFAGGAPMNYTGRREAGWWYRKESPNDQWSFSWSVSHSLYWYLAAGEAGLHAQEVSSPSKLTIGDVIVYDFEGDGRYDHSTIVTGKDAAGMPLVNAHTVNSKRRYWDYRDSYAWSEATTYRFFRMPDGPGSV